MPHERERQIESAFKKLASHSPIVGLFGHRQTGKTTFLESFSNHYHTLDDPYSLNLARTQPKEFLFNLFPNNKKGNKLYTTSKISPRIVAGIAIDECQLAPELFPVLKLAVQKNKVPGQFYLTGSVRFTSRKAIRESLTGRIAIIEMLPLVVSEIAKYPLPYTLPRMLEAETWSQWLETNSVISQTKELRKRQAAFEKYLTFGGLPRVTFTREAESRNRILQDILNTQLDRDLRLIIDTDVPFSQLKKLITKIANDPLQPQKWSELAKHAQISVKTAARLVEGLKSIFLLREISVCGDSRKGSLFWLEDQAEQLLFAERSQSHAVQVITAFYRNIRAQFEYNLGMSPSFESYLTRAGAQVPLVIKTRDHTMGILYSPTQASLTRSQKSSMDSFLKTFFKSKILVITDEPKWSLHSESILFGPIAECI